MAVFDYQTLLFSSQPVDCETSVELWLHSVLSAIKSSLQVGLASALGVPIPESLKFGSSSPHEPPPQDKKEPKGGTPVSSQQRKVIFAPDTEAVEKLEHTARSEINLPSSWSLRNPNEIVILALQIELTQKFEKCLDEIQSGDKDSLERMHQHLSAILRSASDLLQGASAADRVHEVITSQPLDKNCENVNDEEANDEGDAPESTPAPPNIKIVLSPRQIQKLTNLIFILSAKCDLALKLSKLAKTTDQNDNKEGEGDISKTFERQAQLKYFWSQSNATCNITMMDYSSEYGFEYQGTASRIVSTPETDRALFWTIQGMSSCAPCLIIGSSVSLDVYLKIYLDSTCIICNYTCDAIGYVVTGVAPEISDRKFKYQQGNREIETPPKALYFFYDVLKLLKRNAQYCWLKVD